MRSELGADVTEMMNWVHLGVNSWFSPEAILIFRKIARGSGDISESPPWGRNEPAGSSGPLGRPHQVRAACRVIIYIYICHAPAQGLGVIGAHHRRDSNRAGPGTRRKPDGSCVWSAWADGTARWVLPPSTSCGSITKWVLNQAAHKYFQWPKVFKKCACARS